MYKIIALIGEAGCGKDTILQDILKKLPSDFNEIISCTTRPIREGEVEGINYYYFEDEDFLKKVRNNEMLEYTFFNDWYYGTSYDSLSKDKTNIGVFNPFGIRSLMYRDNIELTVYRITCSDKVRLLRQLNREDHPNVEEIIRRYNTDKKDFENLEFKYINIQNETEHDLDLAAYTILTDFCHRADQDKNQ